MRNTLDRSALPRPRLLPQVQEEEGDEPDEEFVDEELEEYEGSEQTSGQVCSLRVSVVGTCTLGAGQAPWLLATLNAVEMPTLCLRKHASSSLEVADDSRKQVHFVYSCGEAVSKFG